MFMNIFKRYIAKCLFKVIPESRLFRVKVALLNWCGHAVDRSARISSSINIYGPGKLVIGAGVWVGPNVKFYVNNSEIKIGHYCDVAPEVAFVTGSHYIAKDSKRMAGEGYCLPINVGAGSWLCFRSVIHAGVLIPERTIVSSNEVVK